jgi:hypothetical protein
MDSGILISYELNKLPLPERCRIYRKLNGWKDKSQYSKYSYDRKGILSSIPHILVNRCVLIAGKEEADKIISFLKENNAEVFVRDIILTKQDIEKLSK